TALASERACCPTRLGPMLAAPDSLPLRALTAGNQRAMDLARTSTRIMEASEATLAMAGALLEPLLPTKTVEILRNPRTTYRLRSPSPADKAAVREELLAAGLITDRVTVDGIFPPVGDAHEAPQAFWSAPGSTYAGHHSYPGGLVVHEWTN